MDFSFGNKILSDLNSEAVMEIELTGRLAQWRVFENWNTGNNHRTTNNISILLVLTS